MILGFEVHYRYTNGVKLTYTNTGRNSATKHVHVWFEGEKAWICAWYGPDHLEAEPKSILAEKVKPEVFHFPWRTRNATFSTA